MSQEALTEAVLSVKSISKSFGAQQIFSDASLTVHEGDRIGLIGRNGSGKSTLLRIMADADAPEGGEITTRQGLRVAMLGQRCSFDAGKTVADVLAYASRDYREKQALYHELTAEMARDGGSTELSARLSALQHELDVSGGWDFEHMLKRLRTELSLPPDHQLTQHLSGGEQRRLDMASTLIQHPDVLLLDEPTNHIDIQSIQWLEEFLASYAGTCVVVTHDRYFLERVVTRIVEVADTSLYSYPGNYSVYLERKAARLEHEARAEANRESVMRRELAWLQRGAKARTTKQKARIGRYEAMQEEEGPSRDPEFAFLVPAPPRLSKRVIDAEGVGKSYAGKPLFRELDLIMQKGMRVGIAGPNGSGKSTLLRVLMGREEPDAGRVMLGENTEFCYVDQTHEEVNPNHTILQHVSNGADYMEVNGQRLYVPGYLERFLFDRSTLNMPMQNLSGGERNRIDLVKKLLRGGNVLVLDEPTNDLDLFTLRVLEEMVLSFDGSALLVSHDRYFLNRLCTHVLVLEGGGEVVQTAGNYEDYLRVAAERRARVAQERKQTERAIRKAEQKPKRDQPDRPRRLSYHEQRELESMEERILAAEEEAEALEREINEPDFYRKEPAEVQAVLDKHVKAREAVESLYARWSELEAISR